MASTIILILRAIQAVFAIIVMGTGAYSAHVVDTEFSYCYGYTFVSCDDIAVPAQLSYILFVAIWTILALVVLVAGPIFFSSIVPALAIAVVDGLTMLFWFAGSIALAAWTGAGTGGSSWYQTLQACVAFSFFTWALFVATLVLAVLTINKGASEGSGWSSRTKKDQNANPELQPGVQV